MAAFVSSRASLDTGNRTRSKATITVVARKRPLLKSEISRGSTDSISFDPESNKKLRLTEAKKDITGATVLQSHEFHFDRVYGASHTTVDVYEDCVLPLIDQFMERGGKNSVFTYGQTGSGKSFSMLGCPTLYKNRSSSAEDLDMEFPINPPLQKRENWGFFQLSIEHIFETMQQLGAPCWIRLSSYEIYANKVYDLLNCRNVLRPLEGPSGDVNVHGLEFVYCDNPISIYELVTTALRTRIVGSNARNKTSSRGHLVATIEMIDAIPQGLRNGERLTVSATNQNRDERHPPARFGGKIAFIDLAGTERGSDNLNQFGGSKTNSDGACINRSLLALKECFRAIDNDASHIPFRNSQLTKVLREFLVPDDACTVMMAHVSPASNGIESAINALQYTSMVMDLRKRCSPLLICPPPIPHKDELYFLVHPKTLPVVQPKTPRPENHQLDRPRRRQTTLPADLPMTARSKPDPKSTIKPAWQGTAGQDRRSSHTSGSRGYATSRASLNHQNHLEQLLPSPDARNFDELSEDTGNTMRSHLNSGLAPPTPRSNSGSGMMNRRITKTNSGLMRPVYTPQERSNINKKNHATSNYSLEDIHRLIDETEVDSGTFIKCKMSLSSHLEKTLNALKAGSQDPSVAEELRVIVALEARSFSNLKDYLNDIESIYASQLIPSIDSQSAQLHLSHGFMNVPTLSTPPDCTLSGNFEDDLMTDLATDQVAQDRGSNPSPQYPTLEGSRKRSRLSE